MISKPIQTCKRCYITSRFPGVSFDEQGICDFCRKLSSPEQQQKLKEALEINQLDELKTIAEKIKLESAKNVLQEIHWIQFRGNQSSLVSEINKDVEKTGVIEILEEGYYLNFPLKIIEGKTRNYRFNKTKIGAIVFVKPADESSIMALGQLIREYRRKGLVIAQGILHPRDTEKKGGK